LEDVTEALELILSERLKTNVKVSPLGDIRDALETNGIVAPKGFLTGPREYVAIRQ
jgi:hypothetical protein